MFCTQCGKEIKSGTKFCTNCGFKFDYDVQPEIEKSEKPKSFGRLDLKSIKFLENPILNLVILIIFFTVGIPFLPLIIPIFIIYFILTKIFNKNKG